MPGGIWIAELGWQKEARISHLSEPPVGSPTEEGPTFLKRVLHLLNRLQRHDCAGLAAEMTYHWMTSLVPLMIFLFTLFGLLHSQGDMFSRLMQGLRRLVPEQGYDLVLSSLQTLVRESSEELALVSFLLSLWIASNGSLTMEKAFARFYNLPPGSVPFWKQRAMALVVTLGLGMGLLVSINLVVFGRAILQLLQDSFHFSELTLAILSGVQWLLPLAGLFLVSWWVYALVPWSVNRRYWKKLWPGALIFVFLWIVFSLLFRQYVGYMTENSKIYGTMGAVMLLMGWLYLSAWALLLGAEVNAQRLLSFQSRKSVQPAESSLET